MFKYTNAFTNRSGDSLPGYFARLYDSGGNLVSIYADASETPISTVSGVANAALSDENGMFRWYVANGTYDIRFYDANDVFVSVETGVPMIDASGVYTDLSGDDGAALVGFLQDGTGAIARTAQAKARDVVNAKDFCTADNSTNDTAKFQAAMDATEEYSVGYAKALRMSNGLYRMGSSLVPANSLRIYGEGPAASKFSNEAAPLTVATFDAAGAFNFGEFHSFEARGFRNLLKVAGAVDGLTIRDVSALQMSEAALEFNGALQTAVIQRFTAESCKYGIVGATTTNNLVSVYDAQFKNLTDAAIVLDGSEDFHCYNARFEGSVAAGKSALLLDGPQHLFLRGGYHEGAHEKALTWTNPTGVVVFEGFHWTYYTAGVPFLWDANGGQLVFINCESEVAMTVPAGSILIGINRNISVASISSVASAPTTTLPRGQRIVNITGTSGIGAFTGGADYVGQITTLKFAASLTINDVSTGGNTYLAGAANFSATANDCLTIFHDGTAWYEVSRSVN